MSTILFLGIILTQIHTAHSWCSPNSITDTLARSHVSVFASGNPRLKTLWRPAGYGCVGHHIIRRSIDCSIYLGGAPPLTVFQATETVWYSSICSGALPTITLSHRLALCSHSFHNPVFCRLYLQLYVSRFAETQTIIFYRFILPWL